MKIIVADDEESVLVVLRHHIQAYGSPFSRIFPATDGQELLERCETVKPDIVFADIQMPGLSGLDALSDLSAHGMLETCSVYIVSGFSEFSYAHKALTLGVRDYLLKPVKAAQISAILRREESERFPGIPFGDLYALGEKDAGVISYTVESLAMAYRSGSKDMYATAFSEWIARTREKNVPIDSSYFLKNFHVGAEGREAQEKQLALLAAGMGTENNAQADVKTQIFAFIKAHFSEQTFGLQTVADRFGYSTQYISQICHGEKGVPFPSYITALRLEKAKELLTQENLKIKDVAEACGYSYPSYFIKLFQKETGFTPAEWRLSRERG